MWHITVNCFVDSQIGETKNFVSLIFFNPCHAEYLHVLHSSPIFILLTGTIPVVSMGLQAELKTVLILIRWLPQRPADLDRHCFQKRINLGSAGSTVVECLTRDRRAAGSSLTGITVLCP